MIIHERNLEQIRQYLVAKHWEGFPFVGYDKTDGPLGRYDIDFFTNEEQAKNFCGENSNRDFFSTKSAYRAMESAIVDKALMAYRNGGVDLAAIIENYHQRLTNQQMFNNKNSKIMIDSNFDYLNNQVIYGGFKEIPSDELRKQMDLGQQQFELKMDTTYGADKVSATLNFTKSDRSEMYFFNHYDIEVQKEGQKEAMKQRFYINNRGQSITLKEAYNLMDGRAIHKTLSTKNEDKYDAWLQLDFKNAKDDGNFKMHTYSENYGFDLESTLKKYPIKELENEQFKDGLLDSLKRGNRQSVTLVKDGQEVKRFIEATPQYKGLNFYDEHNSNRVTESRIESQSQSQPQDKSKGKAANQSQNSGKAEKTNKNSEAKGEAEAKKKSSRRKMSA